MKLNQNGNYSWVDEAGFHSASPNDAQVLNWLAAGNTPEPADPPPAPDFAALRRAAYTAEADPLFFKAQRGEATQADWLAKIAEIKARYPMEAA